MCNHILCLYSRSDVVLHFLQLETLTRCRCISRCVCPERVVERCPRDITLIPHYSSDYWQSGSKKTASQTNHTSNTKVYFLWDGSKSVQLLESYSSPAPHIGYCAPLKKSICACPTCYQAKHHRKACRVRIDIRQHGLVLLLSFFHINTKVQLISKCLFGVFNSPKNK